MEIEPLRNVGVAMNEATLQSVANSVGIKENVANLDEATKVQLRYIQILRSSTEWQGDLARTMISPANTMRILQQQFVLLGRAIESVFLPIIMEVIPYIMLLTQALTKLAKRIASFLGYKIADIDYSKTGKGLKTISGGLGNVSDGIGKVGNNAKKTAKELNTMLAPFDELNTVQTTVDRAGSGGGKGAGAGGGAGYDLPLDGYDMLENLNDKFSSKLDDAKKKLQSFVPIVAAIGAGFLAWKFSKKFIDGLQWLDKIRPKDFVWQFKILGAVNFLADLMKIKKDIDDLIKYGPNFKTVTSLLGDFAGGIGDVLTMLGQYKVGGALKVIQGVAEIVVSIKDIADNGVNWKNANKAINGITDIAIGIGVFTKNWKLAGFATAIQGFTNAIDELQKNWKQIKKGDWSGVDKVALVIDALQVLGGLAVAFSTFGKLKSAKDMTDAASTLGTMASTTQAMEAPTSALTGSLKNVAVNLGLGVVIIAEVTAAAVLFVGAIWALGVELQKVAEAWQPVIDNGNTVLISLGLGTALLVLVGAAAGGIGYLTTATGGTIALAIGVGALVLAEIALVTISFIAEISAVGNALNQMAIAWQPVIENGETVKYGIETGTGLLLGVGAASAALGVATVASVGLLPVAIDLGSAMLEKVSKATVNFVKNLSSVANEINNNLTPKLETMNSNSDTVTSGLKKYKQFLIDFSDILVQTAKNNIIAGLSSSVSTIIGWFSKDPIKTFAKDVNKTYNQTTDLNAKLNEAIPELKLAISLTTNYLALIKQLDKATKSNKISNLSGKLFVNMKDAGSKIVLGLVDGMNSQMGGYNNAINNIYNSLNTGRAWSYGYNFGTSIGNGINRGIKDTLKLNIRLRDTSDNRTAAQFKISAYAQGGYPESGELFFANENGPEMVGRIGNKTAVANNDQITNAITNALVTALNNYQSNSQPAQTTIYIGNKKIYEGYGDYVNSENDRYGTNTIRI